MECSQYDRHCVYVLYIICYLQQSCEVLTIIIPILQVRRVKLRKVLNLPVVTQFIGGRARILFLISFFFCLNNRNLFSHSSGGIGI